MKIKLMIWLIHVMLIVNYCSASSCPGGDWRCGSGECFVKQFICDSIEQCEDNSDEGSEPGQGCNLFPESGCISYGGRRHYKCQRTGECYPDKAGAELCESDKTTDQPQQDCVLETGQSGWRCRDGRCIEISSVCDGVSQCQDGSDEASDEYDGCNRYPDLDTGNCSSWFGQYHRLCEVESVSVCTLDHLADTGAEEECRQCVDHHQWRCDNGWCINKTLVRNGVYDCEDGSDEDWDLSVGWCYLLLWTMIIVIIGLIISYLCRSLKKRNPSSLFKCPECQHHHETVNYSPNHSLSVSPSSGVVMRKSSRRHRRDNSRCSIITKDEDDIIPDDDIPSDLICLLENKSANWDARQRNKFLATLHGSPVSTRELKTEIISVAKSQYVLVHNDSILYHHLYMYFANRCSTVRELQKVTKYLFR